MMDKKAEIIFAMQDFSQALNKYHQGTQTVEYVDQTLQELRKSESSEFKGVFLYFLMKAAMLRTSEKVELNETERILWHKVASYKDVANNLFFGMEM